MREAVFLTEYPAGRTRRAGICMPRVRRGDVGTQGSCTAIALLWRRRVAAAGTTTERSGSILIFPKVVYDGSRDTFIQISNTTNSMVHAHCFYVNAAPICCSGVGDCLANTLHRALRTAVAGGRFQHLADQAAADALGGRVGPLHQPAATCRLRLRPDAATTTATGPASIPAGCRRWPFPFLGELRCIEVDQSGAPISGNHLKGEATIVDQRRRREQVQRRRPARRAVNQQRRQHALPGRRRQRRVPERRRVRGLRPSTRS